MPLGIKDNVIQDVLEEDVDVEFTNSNKFFGSHANLVPLQSAVAAPRIFYGSRFMNQALPLIGAEAPLVQNLNSDDEQGRSFDELQGRASGAVFSDSDGRVKDITPDYITLETPDGKEVRRNLYNNFIFNRKTSIHNTPLVELGQSVKAGQLLAKSNFTDDKGTLAMGRNARVGVVPYKGFTMDDSIAISSDFAGKLSSEHTETYSLEKDKVIKSGLNHFISLFPDKYTKAQRATITPDGVVKKGTILQEGDPMILASKPRMVSSSASQMGKLSKVMRESRTDASQLWESSKPGKVLDVVNTPKGIKVVVQSIKPAEEGDKIVYRSGQKGIISKIIPNEHMPRTTDGKPLEVLLNPLSIPSRVNNSIIYEILLGKIAQKTGKPIKMPGFTKPGEEWFDIIQRALDEAGLSDTEEVFDPMSGKTLQNPITVGNGYVLKLHHTGASKASARGQGSYCYDEETEVLTDTGWTAWPAVNASHKLATLDDSDSIVFQKPSELIAQDYSGEMYGFKESNYIDYLVTPEHDHWVKFRGPVSEYRRVKAKDLHGKMFYVKRQGFKYTGGVDPKSTTILEDGHVEPIKFDWGDYVEFMGWWLTEGSVRLNENTSENEVYIRQSKHTSEANFYRIQKLLDRVGIAYRVHTNKEKQSLGFCMSSKALARHLKESCGGSECGNKSITHTLLHASYASRMLLYNVMMLGDGCLSTGVYTTSSKALIDTFQILVTGLGWSAVPHCREVRPTTDGPVSNPVYETTTSKKRANALIQQAPRYSGKFYTKHYEGRIYCAVMGGRGLLYVRRCGKPMWSGNSLDQQPLKGGSEGGKAKRFSGLEVGSMLSAGAYKTLREGSTLRGQQNDEYWRQLRQGKTPRRPGEPFVWRKFQTLLQGAGMNPRDMGGGQLRLGPLTETELQKRKPFEIRNGKMVNLNSLEPEAGGLFDPALVGSGKWGKIPLDMALPNPAFEKPILRLLGLTQKDFNAIMAGEMELPERLR